jgi:hypothetical protein
LRERSTVVGRTVLQNDSQWTWEARGSVHAVINQLVNLQRLPKKPRAAANCPWPDGINTVVGLVTIARLERPAALVHTISAQVDPHATLIRRAAKRL